MRGLARRSRSGATHREGAPRGLVRAGAFALASVALVGCVVACSGATPQAGAVSAGTAATAPGPAAAKNAFDRSAASVDTWQLVGPLPDAADATPASQEDPWSRLLAEVAATSQRPVTLSRSMECAARQVASFVLAREALPPDPLARFIAARCGVLSGSFHMGYRSAELPPSISDAGVFEELSADVKADVQKLLPGDRRVAGIAVARIGKRAVVAMAVSPEEVAIESVPLVPSDGKVVLRGKLLYPAATIRALVTRGQFGYEECVRDVEQTLPAFSVECPVAADDVSARIEVASFQVGRDLGEGILDMTVFPAGKTLDAWSRPAPKGGAPLAPGAPATPAFLEWVNAARKEAGMADLRLSETQSRVAQEVAPQYYAALLGWVEPMTGDKVAVGMMAGREVQGMVRDGHFGSQWIAGRTPAVLVDRILASPFGRETLLDRRASLIAVGVLPDDDVLAAIFSTYSVLDGSGKTDYPGEVLSRLSKLRIKNRRAEPQGAPEIGAVLADAVARVEGGTAPKEALDQATKGALAAIKSGRVQGFFVTTSSVEKLDFPPELVTRPALRIGVAVARYRPEGSPWTRLGVLMVAVEPPQTMGEALRTAETRSPDAGGR